MNDSELDRLAEDVVRARSYELSEGPEAGTPVENWLRAERELTVAHDYDTVDRDLERLGVTVSRLPSEAGVVWRLRLPRGECVEAWEPGNTGLAPPEEIARLIEGALAGKLLVPAPPLTSDPGTLRLREMLEEQRHSLLAHDPGTRLGTDPENLHQHRVAARRTRAFLRATRGFVDPDWRRSLTDPLRELGEVTGPVRDLDVLLEHLDDQLRGLDELDQAAGKSLVTTLEIERARARRQLVDRLESNGYGVLLARLRFPPRLAADIKSIPLEKVARREFRRLAKAVGGLGKHPDDAALHHLRIVLKRARYTAELSAPRGKAGRRFLADAKALQTLLGEHQDAVVAEERLRTATVVDESTGAAFVAGRIAERQVARRTRVLAQLPAAWRRLRRSGAQLK